MPLASEASGIPSLLKPDIKRMNMIPPPANLTSQPLILKKWVKRGAGGEMFKALGWPRHLSLHALKKLILMQRGDTSLFRLVTNLHELRSLYHPQLGSPQQDTDGCGVFGLCQLWRGRVCLSLPSNRHRIPGSRRLRPQKPPLF